jgi:hypothetical protein
MLVLPKSLAKFVVNFPRKKAFLPTASLSMLVVLYQLSMLTDYGPSTLFPSHQSTPGTLSTRPHTTDGGKLYRANVHQYHPVNSTIALSLGPTTRPSRIQHELWGEDQSSKNVRLERLATVKESFRYAWKGYKAHAWLQDEVGPLSGCS